MLASGFGQLSHREREVLALVAFYCTDAEIAEALSISVRTVNGHVVAILRKLDVPNRRALPGSGRTGATDAGGRGRIQTRVRQARMGASRGRTAMRTTLVRVGSLAVVLLGLFVGLLGALLLSPMRSAASYTWALPIRHTSRTAQTRSPIERRTST
ncbi:MAG: helix-turn-helix transcriptional regulator [Dehalococcoidia bacterium]|nr:helix-turn-helix transcriptional regulator [Dehalococcoidia bacterium]